ncbi:MAG TPA: hypothetical protein PLP29_05830 [Candidatus Ozemobacteraceae bacterium]|nr:hypothetical protein [Candidatus Ozemobacteraceae bacterium]
MKRFALAAWMSLFLAGAALAGPRVVFTGEISANPDLYSLDLATVPAEPRHPGAAGTLPASYGADKVVRLTNASTAEMQPSVAADGKTIAFVSDADGAPSLYLMDAAAPQAPWQRVSPGMGAYAHPAFSPDGGQIAVSYAPDPEAPLTGTCIALVDPKAKTQAVLIRGSDVRPGYDAADGPVLVLDRPHWVDAGSLLFVALEYADAESGRLLSATMYRFAIAGKTLTRLAGGESYFDEQGAPRGFKASVPWCRPDGGLVTFAAIQGHFDRTAMAMKPDATEKRVLPIRDPEFWGPAIPVEGEYLYGFRGDDGRLGLALTTKAGKGPRRVIGFGGAALDPIVVP